ncbi:FMN-binding negative transcriptional regulator [Thalassotalea profundi]|uniref:Protease synthase and sporulation protein PAI 2 n=1 Tax=Thalassotalea profundi TaxID=2036687 RepID=A0ABQ3IUU4_9GAMM|nr:FMN-binding negative transcriptional regulator [Thalassotalea profundi]GHE93636.1 protease synthase and sporulation protein PAI 2 [Thalassotalea profundi]
MYVPEKWKMPELADIHQFIHKYSFVTLVSPSLQATRLPVLFDSESNCLIGHFARTNPHWREIEAQECLVIIDGPHAYISPTWYQQAPNVPTWNYASVHIKGRASLLTEKENLEGLNRLIAKYEPSLLNKRTTVTAEHQQKLSKGIVGFKIDIHNIDAKAKLGQHRTSDDQLGVVDGLKMQNSPDSQALLSLMHSLKLGLG